MRHLTARERGRATAGNLRSKNTCCIVPDMGKSSKKSINSNRPARRARRGTAAAAETVATAAVTPAADDVTAAAPVSEAATADAPATEAAPAPSRQDVQQLAFYY